MSTLTKIIIITLLMSLFALPNALFAQGEVDSFVIRGKVLEKGTRKPLASAYVYVIEADSLFSVTHPDGTFELVVPEPGVYPIQAVASGFDKSTPVVVRMLDTKAVDNIILYTIPAVNLPTIVVEGERNEDQVGKTVITGRDLEQVAGSAGDPLRAMQALPGVVTPSDGSAEPAIRGSNPGDNAYYIDGIPVEYLYHVGGLVSVIPADLVSDFNLYAAGFGPQYADVLGGVIDVGLRNPRTDRIGGIINMSFLSSEFLVEGPITDSQSFLFSARRSYLDLVVKQVEDQEEDVKFKVPEYSDYMGKYLWDINNDQRISFYLNGAGDSTEFSIGENADIAKKEPVIVGDSNIDESYHNQTLVWDSHLTTSFDNKLIVGHSYSSSEVVIGTALKQLVEFDSFYVREQLSSQPHPQHKVLIGSDLWTRDIGVEVDALTENCNPEFQSCGPISGGERNQLSESFRVNSTSLYLRDRWVFLPAYTMVAGLRYSSEDYLDQSYLEPRLGIEWRYSDKTQWTAGWGVYNQFPDGEQVLENIGNPQLSHLRAEHSLIGVQHKLNKAWSLKSEVYYKAFDDLVVGVVDERNYINNATGDAYGAELLIKKEHTDQLWGWLAVTLSKSERTDNLGKTFPFEYDQPVITTLVTNYTFARNWTFGLKWQYHTGKPYTAILGSESVVDPNDPNNVLYYAPVYNENKNSARLPPYHRLDLRIDRDWTFNSWKLNTYFEIFNVYNRCNVEGYEYDESYSAASKAEICGVPLLPSFGVEAQF